MTIMWESQTNAPGTVHYGRFGRLGDEVRQEKPKAFTAVAGSITNQYYLYEVTLNGLEAGALYSYAVELAGVCTAPKQFKTFSDDLRAVHFIAYGDSRSFPKLHAALARNFKKHSPDFILHMGDLVNSGVQHELWGKEFFGPLASVIDEVPLFAAIGNHEDDGTNYGRYLHLPERRRWYSFEAGPVHVLALDYREEKPTSEQFRFARQDLLSTRAPWKIVMLHFPVFNLGGHATTWGHEAYLPLFHEAKVDLVLAGHSHLYERFRPVAPAYPVGSWPITYVVTGGGGAELATSYKHPALAARFAAHHYTTFEVTRDTLRGRAYSSAGALLDAFEINKRGGQAPAEYFAQVYPEEWLKLTFEAAKNLTAQIAAVPSATNAAEAMFTLAATKTTAQPLELDIELTPESSAFYTLENGPVHVTTPAMGVSNKVVWAKILSTGRKNIKGALGQDLSPTLSFQAKVRLPGLQTFAYGQACHFSQTALEAARKLGPTMALK